MELCQESNCDNRPLAICLHCQQHLCLDHISEHQKQLLNQANDYCDELNRLKEEMETISFEDQYRSAAEKINQWFDEEKKQLEEVHQNKLQRLREQQQKTNDKVKTFQQTQRTKISDIQRQFFTPELTKNINADVLKRIKSILDELRAETEDVRLRHSLISLPESFVKLLVQNINPNDSNSTAVAPKPPENVIRTGLNVDAKPFALIW